MSSNDLETPSMRPPETSWRFSRYLRRTAVTVTLLGLIVTNILTLTNEAAHAIGYQAVRALLTTTLSEAFATRLLNSSPTMKRQYIAETATRDLTAINRRLVASRRALELEHAALKRSFRAIEAERAALRRTVASRSAIVQKFSARQAIKAASRATRSVASVPGESIPLLGVGVAVALVAWDVYDACAMLKEINALNAEFGNAPEDQTRVCGMRVPTQEEVLAQVKRNWRDAYRTAAAAVYPAESEATRAVTRPAVPDTPSPPSWGELRNFVCPIFAAVPGLCP